MSFFAYYMGPPQVSFFAYYMGAHPQVSFFAYYMGAPLRSVSLLTVWGGRQNPTKHFFKFIYKEKFEKF